MFKKLDDLEQHFKELTEKMADPEVATNSNELVRLAKARANLEPVVDAYREWKQITAELAEARDILENEKDPDLRELAAEEVNPLEKRVEELGEDLKVMLLPKDPNDERNTIVEIRAGAGGEEAALFAADLFRMYTKYAESRGWKVEIMTTHDTGIGGIKEIIFTVLGDRVYSRMKFESGVHRVQRVPVTEASGRIHTSTATVAVLPEADELDLDIDPNELRIDVYRSQGPGGQSVNTTDSAVRITHVPTGLVVQCQDEKSQHKNKARALKILRARLKAKLEEEQAAERSAERLAQVGTGDRSEKIRTYNHPQGRVTEHRIKLTLYKLQGILDGALDEIIDSLIAEQQAETLKKVGSRSDAAEA